MGVKTKIIAIVIAIMATLVPLSQMVCARGACRTKVDSSSMPCHALKIPKSDETVGSTVDRSCCRLWPLLPRPARDRMIVQRSEQELFSSFSKCPNLERVSELSLHVSPATGPPGSQQQSLSRVLLI